MTRIRSILNAGRKPKEKQDFTQHPTREEELASYALIRRLSDEARVRGDWKPKRPVVPKGYRWKSTT